MHYSSREDVLLHCIHYICRRTYELDQIATAAGDAAISLHLSSSSESPIYMLCAKAPKAKAPSQRNGTFICQRRQCAVRDLTRSGIPLALHVATTCMAGLISSTRMQGFAETARGETITYELYSLKHETNPPPPPQSSSASDVGPALLSVRAQAVTCRLS